MLESIACTLDVGMLTMGVISVIYLLAFDPSYKSPVSRVDAKDGHGKVARLERAEKRLKKGFQMRRVASGGGGVWQNGGAGGCVFFVGRVFVKWGGE